MSEEETLEELRKRKEELDALVQQKEEDVLIAEGKRLKSYKLLMNIYEQVYNLVETLKEDTNNAILRRQLEDAIHYRERRIQAENIRDYIRATIGNELQNWEELNDIWKRE